MIEMQINKEVIKEKKLKKDSILKNKEFLLNYVRKELGDNTKISQILKSNGGGATLFLLINNEGRYILKVKERTVFVESKLEEERDYIYLPALQYEYEMISKVQNYGVRVPTIKFYKRENQFDFLALEYIEESLVDVLQNSDIETIIELWNQIECEVNKLYENGIIHSDLHEDNIRCRDKKIFIIDFEESREINQKVKFKESLDYIGQNEKSTLGIHSLYFEQEYSTPFNCLQRLKEVFNKYMAEQLFKYVKECNYDSNNGIVYSLDHGSNSMTYQGIHNRYFAIGGQRNEDERSKIINIVIKNIVDDEFTFIDVGSNNGQFCREMSLNNQLAKRCIGLEGFEKFNILARGLAFLDNIDNVEYINFLCGVNSIIELGIEGKVVFSICSVWHHIKDKRQFLKEIKNLDIQALLFEFATQEGIYEGKNWDVELKSIINFLDFQYCHIIAISQDYNRPIVLVTKGEIDEQIINKIKTDIKELDMRRGGENHKREFFNKYLNGDEAIRNCCACFGTGAYGRKAYELFKDKIIFFIDNRSQEEFMGFPVLSPREASYILHDNTRIIITTSGKYYKEIEQQLDMLGVKNYITLNDVLTNGIRFI